MHPATNNHRPAAVTATGSDPLRNLEITGYLTAILMPLAGVVVGVLLLAKNRTLTGVAVIIVSVVMVVVWGAVLGVGGAESAPVAPVEPSATEWCNPWNNVADGC